jgi:ABC-type uncharacterized transport system ATPase subunit
MSWAVRMDGVSKRFGEVQALDGVDLHVEAGTLHAVVGENGAGKTTLMRALYGAMNPDQGTIEVNEKPAHFMRSAEAIEAGIGMVSQHYGIIPELTCLQNLILGAEGGPILNLKAAEQRAESLAKKMGFQFDWNANAATLSPGAAQKLEILKLLWRNAKIMILDEPTAMLSPADGDALFGSLRQLVDEGATVILVTHRLPEVFDHCRRVTVLRAGKRVEEKEVSETTKAELARLIVGGEVVEAAKRDYELGQAKILDISNLIVKGARGEDALKSISLSLTAGEIVGIAGVDGSGQRELFRAIAGMAKPQQGTLQLLGQDLQNQTVADRLKTGLRLIPEDRHAEGVVEEWSLEENAALGLQRMPPFAKGNNINSQGRHQEAEQIAAKFNTKHGGLNNTMHSLSGGNQQRFVAARALELNPKLILAFQPARGLDLNATEHVYAGLREACKAGAAALVVSFDLDELLSRCDRLVVMNRGELSTPKPEESTNRETIGRLMVGAM